MFTEVGLANNHSQSLGLGHLTLQTQENQARTFPALLWFTMGQIYNSKEIAQLVKSVPGKTYFPEGKKKSNISESKAAHGLFSQS